MITTRRSVLLLILIALVSVARVAATYRVYTNTFDEPVHVAVGMEWLDRGTYTVEMQHPPLARVATAIGPHLSGIGYPPVPARVTDPSTSWRIGLAILYFRGEYERTLTLARMGILPFLLLAIVVAWAWGRRIYGEAGGVLAALLLANVPPVLAHAGLATTDCAAMATTFAALFALTCWIEQATWGRALLLAIAVGAALMAKFSALLFLPVTAIVIVLMQRRDLRRNHLLQLVAIVPIVVLLSWATYRFSVWPVPLFGWDPQQALSAMFAEPTTIHRFGRWLFAHVRVPAPEAFAGVMHVIDHQRVGHATFLLGDIAQHGHWLFFPVALAVKTPLAFLLLAIGGTGYAIRTRNAAALAPALCAIVIVVVSMPGGINIGVRHILHVYPLLALPATGALLALWNRGRAGRALAIIAVSWQLLSAAATHPDYLPYFNELAGNHPEGILLDSDLDWGQDLGRLGAIVAENHISRIWLAYFGTAVPRLHIPAQIANLPPHQRVEGWVAISETQLAGVYAPEGAAAYGWLKEYAPVARVGRSIRLYFIPPAK